MVGLAEDIIDKMSGEFEPDKFEDRYENAMIELIRSKQAGVPAPTEKAPARPANVVNLMDALRRTMADSGKAGGVMTRPSREAAHAQTSMAVCMGFRPCWIRSALFCRTSR